MKLRYVVTLFAIAILGLSSCTPTNLEGQLQHEQKNPVSTGDDLSIRTDNTKD